MSKMSNYGFYRSYSIRYVFMTYLEIFFFYVMVLDVYQSFTKVVRFDAW